MIFNAFSNVFQMIFNAFSNVFSSDFQCLFECEGTADGACNAVTCSVTRKINRKSTENQWKINGKSVKFPFGNFPFGNFPASERACDLVTRSEGPPPGFGPTTLDRDRVRVTRWCIISDARSLAPNVYFQIFIQFSSNF